MFYYTDNGAPCAQCGSTCVRYDPRAVVETRCWGCGARSAFAPGAGTLLDTAAAVSAAHRATHAARTALYRLARDGETVTVGTETECWGYIHANHCYSVHHALTHEGYTLRRVCP